MKNNCIFVVLKSFKGQNYLSELLGIFYARTTSILINIRQFIPCLRCNGVGNPSLEEVLAAGNGLPFLFSALHKLNSFKMLKTNEISFNGEPIPQSNTFSHETVLLLISELNKLASSSSNKIIINIAVGNNNYQNGVVSCDPPRDYLSSLLTPKSTEL